MIPVNDVETELLKHPAFADVALVGYPDRHSGESACAVVVSRAPEPLELAELRGFLTARGMTEWYQPSQLRVVANLPRNATGKIRKELTVVLAWCPGHAPDGVTLYTENERRSSVVVGHWEADHRLAGTYAELPLARPTLGWRTTRPLPDALDPRRKYVLFGGTRDNSSSTHPVDFTVAALQSNPRDAIRVWAGSRDENDDDAFINVYPAGFQCLVEAAVLLHEDHHVLHIPDVSVPGRLHGRFRGSLARRARAGPHRRPR